VRIDSAVRSFFGYWGITLPDTTIHYKKNSRLRRILEKPSYRHSSIPRQTARKTYAVVAAESGLRANTILKLKWKHIKDDFNNRTGSIALRLEPPFHEGNKKSGLHLHRTKRQENSSNNASNRRKSNRTRNPTLHL